VADEFVAMAEAWARNGNEVWRRPGPNNNANKEAAGQQGRGNSNNRGGNTGGSRTATSSWHSSMARPWSTPSRSTS
jgi:hypothetical protein